MLALWLPIQVGTRPQRLADVTMMFCDAKLSLAAFTSWPQRV